MSGIRTFFSTAELKLAFKNIDSFQFQKLGNKKRQVKEEKPPAIRKLENESPGIFFKINVSLKIIKTKRKQLLQLRLHHRRCCLQVDHSTAGLLSYLFSVVVPPEKSIQNINKILHNY